MEKNNGNRGSAKTPADAPKSSAQEQSRTGAGPAVGKDAQGSGEQNAAIQGLQNNGEFKVGAITLLVANGQLRLRKENEGSEVETDEATVAGILDDHFFTKKVGKNGDVKTKGG